MDTDEIRRRFDEILVCLLADANMNGGLRAPSRERSYDMVRNLANEIVPRKSNKAIR